MDPCSIPCESLQFSYTCKGNHSGNACNIDTPSTKNNTSTLIDTTTHYKCNIKKCAERSLPLSPHMISMQIDGLMLPNETSKRTVKRIPRILQTLPKCGSCHRNVAKWNLTHHIEWRGQLQCGWNGCGERIDFHPPAWTCDFRCLCRGRPWTYRCDDRKTLAAKMIWRQQQQQQQQQVSYIDSPSVLRKHPTIQFQGNLKYAT